MSGNERPLLVGLIIAGPSSMLGLLILVSHPSTDQALVSLAFSEEADSGYGMQKTYLLSVH